MNKEALLEMESLFLALSDRTRLQLLCLIGSSEVSVGYLCDSLGQSQPKISRHLAYLRTAGLVSTRRDGKWIYYKITPPTNALGRALLVNALDWMAGKEHTEFVAPALDATQDISLSTLPDHPESRFIPNELEVFLL
jgi:DNA-binding transcriptional ArsR family regulator